MTKQDTIDGLRRLADFLEKTESIEGFTQTINLFMDKGAVQACAQEATWEKRWYGDWFALAREFGPITLELNLPREQVCKRVVTGTRVVPAQPAHPEQVVEVVEWVCDEPLLAGAKA